MPEAHPRIVLLPKMSCTGVTDSGAKSAPTIISVPLGPSPLTSADIDFESGAVARTTLAPPSLLQSLRGISGAGVDVFVRAEFLGQRLLVAAAADGDGAKAHLAGVLNSQMSEAADSLHGYQVAGARAGIAQRVIDGDAGAQQRRGFVGGEIVGHERDRFGGDDDVLGVTSVEVKGGNFLELAVDEVAAAAGVAGEAVAAVPAHADALAGLPLSYVGADGVDASGNLVAGDARILKARPAAFLHDRVAVADAAGFDFDAHLAAAGFGRGAFDDFEISAGLGDLNRFHGIPLSTVESMKVRILARRPIRKARVCSISTIDQGSDDEDATKKSQLVQFGSHIRPVKREIPSASSGQALRYA